MTARLKTIAELQEWAERPASLFIRRERRERVKAQIAQGNYRMDQAEADAIKNGIPLPYTLGIELTMIPVVATEKDNERGSGIVENYANILKEVAITRKISTYSVHADFAAVEAASLPLKTWEQVRLYYEKMSGLMLELGLRPKHPKTCCGGGHLHLGPLPVKLMVNLFRDLQNKPWLMWVFNEPDNNKNACNFAPELERLKPELVKAAKTVNISPDVFGDMSTDAQTAMLFYGELDSGAVEWLITDKGNVCRYKDSVKTFEMRMFEAPLNWAEQEAQIKFAFAYLAWVDKTYKDKTCEVEIWNTKQLRSFKKETCRDLFLGLLATLGLGHDPYQRMLAENLPSRWAKGRVRV